MAVATESRAPTRRVAAWVAPAAVGAVGLAACVLLRAVDPNEPGNYPLCPFKALTGGVDCPGCGALRATHALTHGHVGVAADHNLLFVLLVPVILAAYVIWAAQRLGVGLIVFRPPRWLIPAFIIVGLAFWGLRLLPGPFEWLASVRA